MRKLAKLAISAAAAAGMVSGVAASAAASPVPQHAQEQPRSQAVVTANTGLYMRTATTKVTGDPDSGGHGNWATDSFTRIMTVRRVGEVAVTNCPATAKVCYLWDYAFSDNGSSAVITGASSPGVPDVTLYTPETASMRGGTVGGQFYSNRPNAYAKLVPAAHNDHGVNATGFYTSGNWPELFLSRRGSLYANVTEGQEGWTYTVNFGGDKACPVYAGKWIDATPTWGSATTDGDIQAPNAATCS